MLVVVDGLLTIGEFSSASGLSARMLRSYAAAGLLVPAAVDAASGYRYYAAGQLQRARVIGLLRRAGIPVARITAFLACPDAAQLERWEGAIASDSEQRRAALAAARSALHLAPVPDPRGSSMFDATTVGAATDRGGRPSNQDATWVSDRLAAVADGIGGLDDGATAARVALETVAAGVEADATLSGLVAAVHAANRAVRDGAGGRDASTGTTLTALARTADAGVAVAHVGDSRCYCHRHGRSVLVTADHSVVADLVGAGHLDAADAASHPHRHVITRAVGVAAEVEVDVASVGCRPGDRLLLCTDGVWAALAHATLEEILSAGEPAQAAAEAVVAAAVVAGTTDNATALVVDLA